MAQLWTLSRVIYVVKEGEDMILYASDDDGVTWNKTVNPKDGQLPQGPSETLDMFSGEGVNIQLTGVEEVNGKPAKVYAGTIDGKLLQQVLNTSGAMNELSEAMGADMSEEALANLSDIDVTIMIDAESGLPVRGTPAAEKSTSLPGPLFPFPYCLPPPPLVYWTR